ncbi:MAG: glycerophosphodiester phosphodiesterase family protein [Hyphomicrobium sp.]|nr:glycerophosphodiester phosphodiesterase family protein [Hyphomicrobium sp.]
MTIGVPLDRRAFLARPIAHRGLHDAAAGVVENTAPAFEAAVRASFGIECDLRPAAGATPVVFHDQTLERLTGDPRLVAEVSSTSLARLRHTGTDAGVMTFRELLDIVGGRQPIFAEIKSEWAAPDPAFLTEIARAAIDYRGPLALMSFDPDVMTVMRELATEIPRGIVSGSYRAAAGDAWWEAIIGRERAERLALLLESAGAAPSFYAYEIGALPTSVTRYVRAVDRLPLLAWTVRKPADWDVVAAHADQAIFEGPVPDQLRLARS